MPRYLISFDDGSMDHIPDEDWTEVGKASHEVIQEAVDAGVRWMDYSREAGLPGPSEVGVDLSGQAVRVAYLQRDIDEHGSEVLREQAEAVMGLPARVVVGDDFFLTSRWNDAAPWRGGGALFRNLPSGNSVDCSAGFSTSTQGGYGRMLTARHCNPHAGAAWKDGAGDPFSLAGDAQQMATNDTLLIDPIGGPRVVCMVGLGTHPQHTPATV